MTSALLDELRTSARDGIARVKHESNVLVEEAKRATIATRAGADETLKEWKRHLGLAGSGSDDVHLLCDLCALPFVHAHVTHPEIQKLQNALDATPNVERALQLAHDELRSLVGPGEEQPLAAAKSAGAAAGAAAGGGASAVALLVEREASYDTKRATAVADASLRTEAGREAFLESLSRQG